jgi:hypothetical protein
MIDEQKKVQLSCAFFQFHFVQALPFQCKSVARVDLEKRPWLDLSASPSQSFDFRRTQLTRKETIGLEK